MDHACGVLCIHIDDGVVPLRSHPLSGLHPIRQERRSCTRSHRQAAYLLPIKRICSVICHRRDLIIVPHAAYSRHFPLPFLDSVPYSWR